MTSVLCKRNKIRLNQSNPINMHSERTFLMHVLQNCNDIQAWMGASIIFLKP